LTTGVTVSVIGPIVSTTGVTMGAVASTIGGDGLNDGRDDGG
jgi:hypothetical protein